MDKSDILIGESTLKILGLRDGSDGAGKYVDMDVFDRRRECDDRAIPKREVVEDGNNYLVFCAN